MLVIVRRREQPPERGEHCRIATDDGDPVVGGQNLFEQPRRQVAARHERQVDPVMTRKAADDAAVAQTHRSRIIGTHQCPFGRRRAGLRQPDQMVGIGRDDIGERLLPGQAADLCNHPVLIQTRKGGPEEHSAFVGRRSCHAATGSGSTGADCRDCLPRLSAACMA